MNHILIGILSICIVVKTVLIINLDIALFNLIYFLSRITSNIFTYLYCTHLLLSHISQWLNSLCSLMHINDEWISWLILVQESINFEKLSFSFVKHTNPIPCQREEEHWSQNISRKKEQQYSRPIQEVVHGDAKHETFPLFVHVSRNICETLAEHQEK